MADKQFCGNGKPFGKYGGFKLGIKIADLPEANDKGYVNLIMSPTKGDPDKYYIAVDDWKPTESQHATAPVTETLGGKDVLPF
jgi:hypothetical protein